jgi:hypothetical protein
MKNKEVDLAQLIKTAQTLGELLPQVTFVGGSTTLLLVEESAHFVIRKI